MAAPLALFVYKRAAHTARTVAALKACDGFADTAVTVFADGPKSAAEADAVAAVRAVVAAELPAARLVAAEANRGLAASIIAGVGEIVAAHGRVIVVEDDLIVAPDFLTFMNAALDRYADEPQVMQVSGHQFDVALGQAAVFLPFVTSWGWATWARAWAAFDPDAAGSAALTTDPALRHRFDLNGAYPYAAMLAKQRRGEVDSWAIRWNWSVFRADGIVLYPPRSLVDNAGFDAEATHTRRRLLHWMPAQPIARGPTIAWPATLRVDSVAYDAVTRHLRHRYGPVHRAASAILAAVSRAAR